MSALELPDFQFALRIGENTYILKNAPDGWDSEDGVTVDFKRSEKAHYIFRSLTAPLKFVTEGAEILRSRYYRTLTNTVIFLVINQLNRRTFQYEQIYEGELDFSQVDDQRDYFEVSVMSGGLDKFIKAYESTQYEIPLTDSDSVNVEVPGIPISEKSDSIISTDSIILSIYPAIQLVNNGFFNGKMVAQSTQRTTGFNVDGYFLRNNSSLTSFRLKISINLSGTGGGSKRIYLERRTSAGVLIERYTIFSFSGAIPSTDVLFDRDINTGSSDRFFILVMTLGSLARVNINRAEINMSYSGESDTYQIKALNAHILLSKLLKNVYDNNDVAVNSYLLKNTKFKNLLITSGDGVRGIPNAHIKTSLKDFLTAMDCLLSIAYGAEPDNSFTLEERSTAYNNYSESVNVGEVKELAVTTYTEALYTDIKVGYDNQDYDKIDGKDEFNTTQNWKLPLSRITSKVLDLVSPYRADSRGIDQIRTELAQQNKSTTDNKSDNDVFMIYCVDGQTNPYRPETGTSFLQVNGVLSPNNQYNYELSPKRCLLRHQGFLASILHGSESSVIRFVSSDKNSDLETISFDGTRVKENENIEVVNLSGKQFIPVRVNFTCKNPVNMQALVNSNRTAQIVFSYEGNTYRGFILEASQSMAKNNEREFVLLLSINNNLLNLVR